MDTMRRAVFFGVAVIVFVAVFLGQAACAEDYTKIPAKGKITLVDLGKGTCIPCKMMAPVLEKVKKRFEGRAEVVVIDIRYDIDQARRFEIRAIPTQIFFDRDGKEVYRHVGFMDENAIADQFAKMGVK
ncbi:MAG TPA: thioredoxin family protein [Deltaproteobacteria bacterium]|nr:thioredoxin family protein [Deltaproteobacteria bacterium]HPR55540.1 thioredoxin family protein [Deltaproteobacteria bacterium]HXK46045.1 thioredoxin family protein [Deltaproteobacteria bacterium]